MRLDVMSEAQTIDDARLVELGLEGDRQAFSQLVERYQSPVCALAYSACGDVSQSEDLGQETFLIAWRKLGELKEPGKFRAWVFGIGRNLINNSLRAKKRNPLSAAEPLPDGVASIAEASPIERAISKEEQEILWRSLENIPESYREPLILFYREEQSIQRVAEILELTEDAVRQRLSRGRKLLQERVSQFVEETLRQTGPGPNFTLSVMAALPALTVAAAGTSAISGTSVKGAAGKAIATVGLLAVIKAVLAKLLPAALGTWLMLLVPESRRERKFVFKSWLLLWIIALAFPLLLYLVGYFGDSIWARHPQAYTVTVLISTVMFTAVIGPYAGWIARVQRRIQQQEAANSPRLRFTSFSRPYEYRSKRTLLGLPLVHIRWNCEEGGKTLAAKGWIAMGNKAFGVIYATGQFSIGCISMGVVPIGLVSVGAFAAGLFAFGGFSLAWVSMGGFAIGYMAFGGGTIGWLGACGGAAMAHYFAVGGGAIAQHANDRAAFHFMNSRFFFRNGWTIFYVLIVYCWLGPGISMLMFKRRRNREFERTQETPVAPL
jgi:RNA polymerase sigma factor (sigma-70 family)